MEARKTKRQNRLSRFWKEWAKPLLLVMLLFFSFRSAIVDWNDVPSDSMSPTILRGDRIFSSLD